MEQKEQIEEKYKELNEYWEVGYCNGIKFVLDVLEEDEFKQQLEEKYD